MALDLSGLTKASDILEANAGGVREVGLHHVQPDPEQPRKHFNHQALTELAESIRTHGIIQPLVVRGNPAGGFIIVAGERRWRAAGMVPLATVPVIVREDLDAFAQVVENIQRENLTPMELYRWIAAQLDQPDMTNGKLAGKVGKSKTWISFYAAIAKMPESFQIALNDGLATDITALNQLFKLWKQEPALAEKLASSGVPITRHAVAALAEKIVARAAASGQPKEQSKASPLPDDEHSSNEANAGAAEPEATSKGTSEPKERDATSAPAPLSFPSEQTPLSSPTGALPVRILVRYENEAFAVRYTSQRKGENGMEVMIENEGGLTLFAPLLDLQVIAISEAQQRHEISESPAKNVSTRRKAG